MSTGINNIIHGTFVQHWCLGTRLTSSLFPSQPLNALDLLVEKAAAVSLQGTGHASQGAAIQPASFSPFYLHAE